MFNALLAAPMGFFFATPRGRVVNVFTTDFGRVDSQLPPILELFIRFATQLIGTAILVGFSSVYTIIALVPVLAIFVWVERFYMSSARELQRLGE